MPEIEKNKIMNNSDINEYMIFDLGAMKYAIELPKIREILTYPEVVTTLPNTGEWVKGLINLRGEVVPILDLRTRFKIGEAVYNDNTAVIAVITEDKRMIGIVVDKVDDVKRIDSADLSAVTDMGSAIPSQYLKWFLRQDGSQMLVVMDIENVVSKEELSWVE